MEKYDYIVIGAGALGSWHAFHLLKAGKKVLLVERDNFANEATVRNFGQLVPSGQKQERWFNYGRRSLEILSSIQNEFDISLRNNGTTYIASDESEMAVLEEMKTLLASQDYASTLWTKEELKAFFPNVDMNYAKGALRFEQEFSAEPRIMIHRVVAYLQQKFPQTLTYRNNTLITKVDIQAEKVLAVNQLGERFEADKLVLCSGHEFRTLFYDIYKASGMRLSKLQMLLLKSQPQTLKGNVLTGLSIRRYEGFHSTKAYQKLIRKPEYDVYDKWGIHILFKQAVDGSIIIGDSHEYSDAENKEQMDFCIREDVNQLMLNEAKKIFKLPLWDVQTTWYGVYAQEDKNGAYQHNLEGKIFIVNGMGGKGMTCSAGFAEESVAQLMNA